MSQYIYWNDESKEAGKAWSDPAVVREHLDSTYLGEAMRQAAGIISESGANLRVLDLACGTGWSSAILSRLPNVRRIIAKDFSAHRMGSLFDNTVRELGGDMSKISKRVGSFYNLESVRGIDAVFMAQGFHHAEEPGTLISEIKKCMSPIGMLVMIGEIPVERYEIAKRFLRTLVREKRIKTSFRDLFPPDKVLGDHYYRWEDYQYLFGIHGMKVARVNHVMVAR